jgi:hypothetical protein
MLGKYQMAHPLEPTNEVLLDLGELNKGATVVGTWVPERGN